MSSIKSRLFGSKKRVIATLTVVVVLVGAGSAFAAWLISSTGPGAGRIGNLQAPTVVAGTPAATSDLVPGGDGDAVVTVTNPNKVALKLVGTSNYLGGSTDDQSNCPVTNITDNTLTGLDITVPKGTSNITIPGAYHLSSDAPTECQGLGFSKNLRLSFST